MAKVRIKIPDQVRRGETFEIRTVALHRMESGFRRRADGGTFPQNLIRTFSCTLAGVEIFGAEFGPGVSANPYLAFSAVATQDGPLQFTWAGDDGFEIVETMELKVV
ncbi:thiosulfate oxidation carrier complex protein SoxZ [Methylopila sp. M107]|uniref:thiosulfate oxidation carrier complex protein SoxZ n=1 Tax=Methylopila sp. M107 TaxID=1101190 RepID=UPI000381B082|nr:thiosulfate oxidation carrier complex protein SoxZ [Methylopila sp. M107]